MSAPHTEQNDPLTFKKFMQIFTFWLCVWGVAAFCLLRYLG